jgi:rare lipoprotein A
MAIMVHDESAPRACAYSSRWVLIVVVALLSACGGTPTRPPADGARTVDAAAVKTSPSARRGAFYKDDGPGDDPPDLAAVADASPRLEALHAYANRPYRVMGQSFVPRTRLEPYRERGVASWYGRRFHGLPTSSGEPYDMYAMTAAHPTLPIPSYARVTRLANGRSVVVRVNDRGPFLHGRIMDLSYAAAWKLGYVGSGSAEVEVEQILAGETDTGTRVARAGEGHAARAGMDGKDAGEVRVARMDDNNDPLAALIAEVLAAEAGKDEREEGRALVSAPPLPLPLPRFPGEMLGQRVFLQLGVFATLENAENLRTRVAAQAAAEFSGRLEIIREDGRFRVYGGPFESLAIARAAAERIEEQLGIRPFPVQREMR